MSHSATALNPAIRVVETAINKRVGVNHFNDLINGKNRIRRNTPAVTSVEE